MRSSKNFKRIHLHIGDNLGVTLGLEKGRGANFSFLCCCRRLAALGLASDCRFAFRWTPSEKNCADEASRRWEKKSSGPKNSFQGGPQGCSLDQARTDQGREDFEEEADDSVRLFHRPASSAGAADFSREQGSQVRGDKTTLRPRDHHLPELERRHGPAHNELNGSRRCPHRLHKLPVLRGWRDLRGNHAKGSMVRSFPGFFGHGSLEVAKTVESDTRLEQLGARLHKASSSVGHRRTDRLAPPPDGTAKCSSPCLSPLLGISASGGRACHAGKRCGAASGEIPLMGDQSPPLLPPGQEQDRATRPQSSGRWSGGLDRSAPGLAAEQLSVSAPVPAELRGDTEVVGCGTDVAPDLSAVCPISAQTRGTFPRQSLSPERCGGDQGPRRLAKRQQFEKVRGPRKATTSPGHLLGRLEGKSHSSDTGLAAPSGKRIAPETEEPWFAVGKTAFELFAGTAGLSKALAARGLQVHTFDSRNGKEHIVNSSTIEARWKDLHADRICFVHVGFPCNTWSLARRHDKVGPGPLRDSDQFLYGLQGLSAVDQQKVDDANHLLAEITCFLHGCIDRRIPFTVENPFSSRIWLTTEMQSLVRRGACFNYTDYCMYGRKFRKRTTFLSFGVGAISLRQCTGTHLCCSRTGKRHELLTGIDSSGNFRTARGNEYPSQLVDQLSDHVLLSLAFNQLESGL